MLPASIRGSSVFGSFKTNAAEYFESATRAWLGARQKLWIGRREHFRSYKHIFPRSCNLKPKSKQTLLNGPVLLRRSPNISVKWTHEFDSSTSRWVIRGESVYNTWELGLKGIVSNWVHSPNIWIPDPTEWKPQLLGVWKVQRLLSFGNRFWFCSWKQTNYAR